MLDPRYAFLTLEAEGWLRQASANAPPAGRTVEQRLTLRPDDVDAQPPALRFRGALDRPALAEITETNPPEPTGATTELQLEHATLRVDAPRLPAYAEIRVAAAGSGWERSGDGARFVFEPGATGQVDALISCSLVEPGGP